MTTKKLVRRSSAKSQVSRKPIAQKMEKYEVEIIQKKGPYADKKTAEAEKSFIKRQVSHSKFSPMKQTSKGFSFEVLHDYTEKFPAGTSTTALAQAFKAQSPSVLSAKVKKA